MTRIEATPPTPNLPRASSPDLWNRPYGRQLEDHEKLEISKNMAMFLDVLASISKDVKGK